MNDKHLIGVRFSFSFVANSIRTFISFLTVFLLARWFGPDDYGRFAFLVATFIALRELIDVSSSEAFFTFISQTNRTLVFVRRYWIWVILELITLVFIIFVLTPQDILDIIWIGESKSLLFLALISVFSQHHIWKIASSMGEASRETIKVQIINLVTTCINLLVVLYLMYSEMLLLHLVFLTLFIQWLIASLIVARLYSYSTKKASESYQKTFTKYWVYCKPFLYYVVVSFLYTFLDRWMLQNWAGSSEQAYYGVASQFSSIALIATASILRIFWKEIAEAYKKEDFKKVHDLYLISIQCFYFISLCFSCLLIPWTKEFILLILGNSYVAGASAFFIMLLYPIHQSIGQIASVMLLSTENTKTYTVIGIIFMILSVLFAYLMLAPTTNSIPGLSLKSEGLAIKMLLAQVIYVNVLSYFVAKKFSWDFVWFYQIKYLIIVMALSFFSKYLIVNLIEINVFFQFIMSSLIYLFIIFFILFKAPSVFNFDFYKIKAYFISRSL